MRSRHRDRQLHLPSRVATTADTTRGDGCASSSFVTPFVPITQFNGRFRDIRVDASPVFCATARFFFFFGESRSRTRATYACARTRDFVRDGASNPFRDFVRRCVFLEGERGGGCERAPLRVYRGETSLADKWHIHTHTRTRSYPPPPTPSRHPVSNFCPLRGRRLTYLSVCVASPDNTDARTDGWRRRWWWYKRHTVHYRFFSRRRCATTTAKDRGGEGTEEAGAGCFAARDEN